MKLGSVMLAMGLVMGAASPAGADSQLARFQRLALESRTQREDCERYGSALLGFDDQNRRVDKVHWSRIKTKKLAFEYLAWLDRHPGTPKATHEAIQLALNDGLKSADPAQLQLAFAALTQCAPVHVFVFLREILESAEPYAWDLSVEERDAITAACFRYIEREALAPNVFLLPVLGLATLRAMANTRFIRRERYMSRIEALSAKTRLANDRIRAARVRTAERVRIELAEAEKLRDELRRLTLDVKTDEVSLVRRNAPSPRR